MDKISEMHKGYGVHGSTGCTCCKGDNFYQGFFSDVSEAIDCAERHKQSRTVCSQYSKTGIYTIRELEYELLADGRVIIGNRVFDDVNLFEHGEVANDLQYSGKDLGLQVGEYSYKR